MHRFDESEDILTKILNSNPQYEDARANLNRLYFQKNLHGNKTKSSSESLEVNNSQTVQDVSDVFSDPLAAAFTDNEVALAGGINTTKERSLILTACLKNYH